jgi:hypothetical protein
LFKQQEDYFDVPSQDLTPRQIREKLAQLASNILPSSSLAEFKDLLTLKGGNNLNGGTGVTDDLKYNSTCFPTQNDPSIYIHFHLFLYSQVFQTEWYSRFAYRHVGWIGCK